MAKSEQNMAKYAVKASPFQVSFLYSNQDDLKAPRKVPRHKHPSWQADLIHEGSAVFVDDEGRESVLGPGDAMLIPPELPHSFVYRKAGVRWMTFWFFSKGLDPSAGPLRIAGSELSKSVFAALQAILSLPEGPRRSNAIGSCLCALFESCLPGGEALAEDVPDGLAGQAMLWIRRSEGRRVDVKEISLALGCSASHLSHAFKAQFGRSLKSYIDESRARMLESLVLHAELSPAELAASLGFRDSCELSRFCKRKLGGSPRTLRKRK